MLKLSSLGQDNLSSAELCNTTHRFLDRYNIVNPVAYCLDFKEGFLKGRARGHIPLNYRAMRCDSNLSDLRHLTSIRTRVLSRLGTLPATSDTFHMSFEEICGFPEEYAGILCKSFGKKFTDTTSGITVRFRHLNAKILKLASEMVSSLQTTDEIKDWILDLFRCPDVKTAVSLHGLSLRHITSMGSVADGIFINFHPMITSSFFNDYQFLNDLHAEYGKVFYDWPVYKQYFIRGGLKSVADEDKITRRLSEYIELYHMLMRFSESDRVGVFVDTQNMPPPLVNSFVRFCNEHLDTKSFEVNLVLSKANKDVWPKMARLRDVSVKSYVSNVDVLNKQNIDVQLASRVTSYYLQNRCTHFVILSGDRDFLFLAEQLSDAEFLFLGSEGNISKTVKECVNRTHTVLSDVDTLIFGNNITRHVAVNSYYTRGIDTVLATCSLDMTPILGKVHEYFKGSDMAVDEYQVRSLLCSYLSGSTVTLRDNGTLSFQNPC